MAFLFLILYFFIMFSVYILYSKSLDVYYKGFSTNLVLRFESHLLGKSTYTSKADDWEIVFHQKFETKREALIEEKRLKKLNRNSLQKILKG